MAPLRIIRPNRASSLGISKTGELPNRVYAREHNAAGQALVQTEVSAKRLPVL
jgi:hypothetical protein